MDCLLEEPYNPIIQKCCRKFEINFRYDILIIWLFECIIPEIILHLIFNGFTVVIDQFNTTLTESTIS